MRWGKLKLGEIIEVKKGKYITKKEAVEGSYPVILGGREPAYYINQYNHVGKAIVVSRSGASAGYVSFWNEPIFVTDGFLIEPRESVDVDFLYYLMKSQENQFLGLQGGSAIPHVTPRTIGAVNVFLPTMEEQLKIVTVMKSYDTLIENNQKQIKLLEEAAQRLYKEWFVDLRFPGHETTPVVDGVPEGWTRTFMRDMCDAVGGGTPSTKVDEYYRDGNIRWVTPTDITRKQGLVLLDTEKKITNSGLQNSSAKMLPPYTILMTSRASVGFFGLCEHEVCTNQGFISCIPKKENYRYYLLYNLMNRVEEIRKKASGSTFLEISKSSFRELIVSLPSDDILDSFSLYVKDLIGAMKILTKKISLLSEARDRLLPKLMSGELEG